MKTYPARKYSLPRTRDWRIITPAHPEFGMAGYIKNQTADASGAWPAAIKPVAVPFRISKGCTVVQLGWRNGSAAGNGHDIGIYLPDWTKKISTGATTGSGNSLWQWVDVADTDLVPGDYYLVKVHDTGTGNRVAFLGVSGQARVMNMAGCFQSTDNSYPLPDPMTNMGAVTSAFRAPTMGFAIRTPL